MTENIRYLNRINQLSEDDMRDYITLHRLLEVEMRKSPKEMDLDLIDECFAQIDELVGEGPTRSPVAVQAKIKEILGTPTSKASHIGKKSRPIAAADTKNRHRVRNFFIILAASLVLLYSSLAVAAKVQGYDNTWEFITQKFIEIFNLDSGESLKEGNITLVMDNDYIEYDSVFELLDAENLEILYPSSLPQETQLVTVQKKIRDNGITSYLFIFNDKNISIIVNNKYNIDLSTKVDLEIYKTANGDFYIKHLENGYYQAMFQLNGYEYLITCDDYHTLIQIITNMKGYPS